MQCLFCEVAARRVESLIVMDDGVTTAFLDHRPLFPGHVLVVPKKHVETLDELPQDLLQPFFGTVQAMTRAVEIAMQAEGTFLAINNRVSQSVPHLHVHVVPRRKGDGLKGFFWPRRKYAENEAESARAAIAKEFERLSPA